MVIDHTGDAVLAANVDYILGDGAKLTVVSVQDWDEKAVHVAQHNALVGRDASFKSVVVTFGGDLVRLHPRVNYAGPGGEAELFGLYFTDAGPAPGAPPPRRPRRRRTASRTSSTRARSRARTPTRSGSATSSSGHRRGHRHLRAEPQPGSHRRRAGRLGPEPGDRDRRDRRRRPRLGDRPLRRRAALLPVLPRHPGRRGPPSRRPRLLRRARPADRSAGRRGAPARQDRGRAGGFRLMAFDRARFTRACATERAGGGHPEAGGTRRHAGLGRLHRGRGVRDQRHLLARERLALRGRGRGLPDRVLAARLRASTCAPASRPAFPRRAPSPFTP